MKELFSKMAHKIKSFLHNIKVWLKNLKYKFFRLFIKYHVRKVRKYAKTLKELESLFEFYMIDVVIGRKFIDIIKNKINYHISKFLNGNGVEITEKDEEISENTEKSEEKIVIKMAEPL